MNSGLYDLLIFIGMAQGLALTIILFLPKFRRHRYLASIIAILTFSSTVSFLWSLNLIRVTPHLLGLTMPMLFLLGPFYYLYTKILFGEPLEQKKVTIHFLPAIVCVLLFMPFYIKSGETKLLYILSSDTETVQLPIQRMIGYGLLILHLAGYQVITHRYLLNLRPENYRHFHHWKSWVKILQIGLTVITVFYIVFYSVYVFTPVQTTFYRDTLNLVTTFFIHLIAFGMIYQTNLADQPGATKRVVQFSEDLVSRVATYILIEKRYLDPKLSLSETAKAVHVTPQKLSKMINQHYGKSFTDLVNEYRVEESKRILVDQKYDIYDMNGIALLSGFQSRTNLTRVFKKHTGITPSEFRSSQRYPKPDSTV